VRHGSIEESSVRKIYVETNVHYMVNIHVRIDRGPFTPDKFARFSRYIS